MGVAVQAEELVAVQAGAEVVPQTTVGTAHQVQRVQVNTWRQLPK